MRQPLIGLTLSGMGDHTPLTTSEIGQLVAEHPDLPHDYLAYLRDVGWGETPSGHMIYSGAISPDEVYPQLGADKQRVLIGDDMQEYCLGYDFASKRYGEFSDSGKWSSFDDDFGLAAYLVTHPISRRAFLLSGFAGWAVAGILTDHARGADGELLRPATTRSTTVPVTTQPAQVLPPVRRITHGPGFHWFGYYDKLQFDPAGRLVLGMRVDFEHRSPKPDDEIGLGYVDLHDNDRWTEIGATKAWNWQQGCMLQWLPGSQTEVIWNAREDGQDDRRFVSHVFDVKTRSRRTLPGPIYAVSPDASWAVYPDFRRLNDTRPGYGYAGVPDPNADKVAPDDAGIWRMDLRTGDTKLIVRLAEIVNVPQPPGAKGEWDATSKHWFNHLLVSPDGKRFIFLHRWRGQKEGRNFSTRMFTAAADGSDLYVLDPSGKTSHFIWRDPRHVAMWTWHASRGERFYLFTDKADQVEPIGADVMTVNGHNTYLPVKGQPGRWILNDTYPDSNRLQHPYLYDTRTGKRHPLGHFHSPREYTGEWRCDTHPRSSADGTKVCIDSPHEGGRQMYLIDVAGMVAEA